MSRDIRPSISSKEGSFLFNGCGNSLYREHKIGTTLSIALEWLLERIQTGEESDFPVCSLQQSDGKFKCNKV